MNGGRRESGAGDRMARRGAGCRPDRGKPVGRDASTTPAYGRHVTGAGWSEAGARAWEREWRESGPRCLAGPKGRRVGPAARVPFSFFLNFFSLKSFNKTFEAFTNLFRG